MQAAYHDGQSRGSQDRLVSNAGSALPASLLVRVATCLCLDFFIRQLGVITVTILKDYMLFARTVQNNTRGIASQLVSAVLLGFSTFHHILITHYYRRDNNSEDGARSSSRLVHKWEYVIQQRLNVGFQGQVFDGQAKEKHVTQK